MLSAPKSNDPLHPKISKFLKQEATLHGWNSSSSQIAETFRVEILNQETTDPSKGFNPLHPNISMHTLHSVLCTFPKVLTRRICLTINRILQLIIISFILITLMFYSGMILKGEIRC